MLFIDEGVSYGGLKPDQMVHSGTVLPKATLLYGKEAIVSSFHMRREFTIFSITLHEQLVSATGR